MKNAEVEVLVELREIRDNYQNVIEVVDRKRVLYIRKIAALEFAITQLEGTISGEEEKAE